MLIVIGRSNQGSEHTVNFDYKNAARFMYSYTLEQSRQCEGHLFSLGALPADIWGGCGVARKAMHLLKFNHDLLDETERSSAAMLLVQCKNCSLENFRSGLIIPQRMERSSVQYTSLSNGWPASILIN